MRTRLSNSNVAVEITHLQNDNNTHISSTCKFFWIGEFPAIRPGVFRIDGAYDNEGKLLIRNTGFDDNTGFVET